MKRFLSIILSIMMLSMLAACSVDGDPIIPNVEPFSETSQENNLESLSWIEIEGTDLDWNEEQIWQNSTLEKEHDDFILLKTESDGNLVSRYSFPQSWYFTETNVLSEDNTLILRELRVSFTYYDSELEIMKRYENLPKPTLLDNCTESVPNFVLDYSEAAIEGIDTASYYRVMSNTIDFVFINHINNMVFWQIFSYKLAAGDLLDTTHGENDLVIYEWKEGVLEDAKEQALTAYTAWLAITKTKISV